MKIPVIDKKMCSHFRNSLQLTKEEMLEKLKNFEDLNLKLKDDLDSATKQLVNNCNDLTYSKTELLKSRREINVSDNNQY